MIDKIIYFICTIFQGFIYLKIYEKNTKETLKPQRLIYLIFISIIMVINNLYSEVPFKLFFAFILTFVMYKSIFRNKTRETIFFVIAVTIVSIFLELIFAILFPAIITDLEILNSNQLIKLPYTLLHCGATYLIFTRKIVQKGLAYLYNTYKSIYNYYTLTTVIILLLWIICYFYGNNVQNTYLYTFIILLFLLLSGLIYAILTKSYNNNLLTIKNKHLEESNGIYKQISEDYSILRHNLTNDLINVKSLLPKKDQDIINNIIKKYEKNFYWLTNINDVPSGIQGLFYIKLSSIKSKKIKFHVNYKLDFDIKDVVNAREYDQICEILGIWIDNAIEACEECKEKVILVEIDGNKEQFIIKITNTFTGELDIEKLGNKKYSTKGRNSGYGLNYIKSIKNKKLQVSYSVVSNLFISSLIFVKNKKGIK